MSEPERPSSEEEKAWPMPESGVESPSFSAESTSPVPFELKHRGTE